MKTHQDYLWLTHFHLSYAPSGFFHLSKKSTSDCEKSIPNYKKTIPFRMAPSGMLRFYQNAKLLRQCPSCPHKGLLLKKWRLCAASSSSQTILLSSFAKI
jgi:hypothetical protein